MSQLDFDERIAQQLDAAYRTADILRRRRLVREALAAAPGERILDVGCGPGYYAAELAEEVGPGGAVVAVDASPQMLAVARQRCAAFDTVTFHQGDASSLPVEDGSFDAAICVQVLEYVADPPAALRELDRALRPGGRVVVWDVDWSTVSMNAREPERTERVLRAWDAHLVHPALPRSLAAQMRAAGFEEVRAEGHVFSAIELSSDSYIGAAIPLIADFVAGRGGVSEDEAGAWVAEQRELADRGEFYFACVQFCFTAAKPLS